MPEDRPGSGPFDRGNFGPFDDLVERLIGDLGSTLGNMPQQSGRRARTGGRTPQLDRFGRDLTEEARRGGLDPVIGRDVEIEQVLEVLARRTKNNPVLVGDPGVGKTAIAGHCPTVADGEVPEARCAVPGWWRSAAAHGRRHPLPGRLRAAADRGDRRGDHGRPKVAVRPRAARRGRRGFPPRAPRWTRPDMLKPGLAGRPADDRRGHGRRVPPAHREGRGTGAPVRAGAHRRAHRRGDHRDPARAASRYETHHEVRIDDAALVSAAESDRYVTDRFLPDKAIDLIDRASARRGSAPAAMPRRPRRRSRRRRPSWWSAPSSCAGPATWPSTPRSSSGRCC